MTAKTKLAQLNVADIIPSGDNPRIINVNSMGFIELINSINAMGVIVPVHVRDHPGQAGKYELLAGERRLLAAAKTKRRTLPAICHGVIDDRDAFEITFIENFARRDLTPLEQGKAVETLLIKYKGDTAAAASKLGKSTRWVLQRQAIHRNLIGKWKKAIVEDEDFKDWTASHLQLIAAMPTEFQKEMLTDYQYGDIPSVKELEKEIAEQMRLLNSAPWDINDDKLLDETGACSCSKCPKRTSCQPGLFDDTTDAEAVKKNNRCLDRNCWDNKLAAYVEQRAVELKKQYGNLVYAVMPDQYICYDEGKSLEKKFGSIVNQWKSSKESAKGALPALIVFGKNAGELRWLKPLGATAKDSRGNARKIGADGKPEPKSLKEKKAELKNKRWCAVLRMLQPKVEKAKVSVIAYVGNDNLIFTVAALAGIFGTSRSQTYCKSNLLWKDFEKLQLMPTTDKAIQTLWEQVRPVLVQRISYCDAITRLPDYYIDEAKQVGKLLGIDIDAMFAEQVKAIPEPKSWKESKKVKGKSKNKKNKGKITKIRTCRICGCTEDNACITPAWSLLLG